MPAATYEPNWINTTEAFIESVYRDIADTHKEIRACLDNLFSIPGEHTRSSWVFSDDILAQSIERGQSLKLIVGTMTYTVMASGRKADEKTIFEGYVTMLNNGLGDRKLPEDKHIPVLVSAGLNGRTDIQFDETRISVLSN